jgi:hypothetical protein
MLGLHFLTNSTRPSGRETESGKSLERSLSVATLCDGRSLPVLPLRASLESFSSARPFVFARDSVTQLPAWRLDNGPGVRPLSFVDPRELASNNLFQSKLHTATL